MSSYVEQGTEEWLDMRKGKITGSKIAAIMGLSPFQTAVDLFDEEMGKKESSPPSFHMLKGQEMEPIIRMAHEQKIDEAFHPRVVVCPDNPRFMASLDGVNFPSTRALEVKYANKDVYIQAVNDVVVPYYMVQCQWAFVCLPSLETLDFVVRRYGTEEQTFVTVTPDHDLMHRMRIAATSFLEALDMDMRPQDDVMEITDPAFPEVAERYIAADYAVTMAEEALKVAKANRDEARAAVLEFTDDGDCYGSGLEITRKSLKGRVDYTKLLQENGIDEATAERYRKPTTYNMKIKVTA